MATQATTPRTDIAPRHASHGLVGDRGASLPRGWRHSAMLAWLRAQPQEQRETALAGLFGFMAAIWAPIGILAFLAKVFTVFLVVSALVLVAAAAPRPTAVAHLTAAVRQHVTPRLRAAWQQLGTASTHVRRELPGALAALGEEAAPVLRAAGERIGRASAAIAATVRRAAAHTRDRLRELGPRPAQSSPRSAR